MTTEGAADRTIAETVKGTWKKHLMVGRNNSNKRKRKNGSAMT
jgi:hypothetical protein